MANCCKDCDRLQSQVPGNGPPRTSFNQPTLYDHFGNYQKFKKAKDEEEFLKARRHELTKFNSNFTDWQISGSKDEFDQLSTQDIARFRQQVRMLHNCERSVIDNAPIASATPNEMTSATASGSMPDDASSSAHPNSHKSLKKKTSLLTISRTPVQCPIGVCERTIGVTSVLSHYLRDHNEDFGVQCQEIYAGKRALLIFDPTTLEFRDNVCLGVLAYGGFQNKQNDRPAERGICMQNAFLPKPHELLDSHLPILIMACKTSWSAMLEDKDVEAKLTRADDCDRHLLVIWLVSVQTTKPIHCTLTVHDKAMTSSRSTITQVRHLNESQNPSEFLHNDTNYMRLSRGEMEILSQAGAECIHLEVLINEYDQ